MVKRKRVLIVSAVLIAAALCGGAYLFSRLHGDARKDTVEPDQNVEVFDTPSAQDAKQNPAFLSNSWEPTLLPPSSRSKMRPVNLPGRLRGLLAAIFPR